MIHSFLLKSFLINNFFKDNLTFSEYIQKFTLLIENSNFLKPCKLNYLKNPRFFYCFIYTVAKSKSWFVCWFETAFCHWYLLMQIEVNNTILFFLRIFNKKIEDSTICNKQLMDRIQKLRNVFLNCTMRIWKLLFTDYWSNDIQIQQSVMNSSWIA